MTTDPTADLIRAVVTHMIGAADDWKSFSMVISLGGGRLSAVSGFAYSPDGAVSAVTARPSQIMPAVEAYLADRYPTDRLCPSSSWCSSIATSRRTRSPSRTRMRPGGR